MKDIVALTLAGALLLVGVLSSSGAAFVSQDCSGSILQVGNRLYLQCAGSSCCVKISTQDAVSGFMYCGCDPTVVPTCCYTVLRYGWPLGPFGDSKGSCNAQDPLCDEGSCVYSSVQHEAACEVSP